MSLGGGLRGTGGSMHLILERLRGDIHPREAWEVLGSGRKPCPGMEMPPADPTPAARGKNHLLQSLGRDLRSIALVTTTLFNPSGPKTERLCLGTAGDGKQGIVSPLDPPFP